MGYSAYVAGSSTNFCYRQKDGSRQYQHCVRKLRGCFRRCTMMIQHFIVFKTIQILDTQVLFVPQESSRNFTVMLKSRHVPDQLQISFGTKNIKRRGKRVKDRDILEQCMCQQYKTFQNVVTSFHDTDSSNKHPLQISPCSIHVKYRARTPRKKKIVYNECLPQHHQRAIILHGRVA